MSYQVLFLLPFMIAVVAFCYSVVLTQPEQLLASVYRWLYERRIFNHNSRACTGKPNHPLFKMLIDCEKCVAGQWALWLFAIVFYKLYVTQDWYITIGLHLYFVSMTILYTVLLRRLLVPRK